MSRERIGIGLYVSKKIAECHGGKLEFSSTRDKGSTFIFTYELEVDENRVTSENLESSE
jgi:light-regulated signal transduction histidine kinase (bacteriophytochrome)